MTLELVDDSRPTAPNGDFAGTPSRTLATELWYPALAASEPEAVDAGADPAGRPYPLIIFGHGFSSFRRQSASYAQHLASHGYVVAAPDFPGSYFGAPGGARLSAVLDQPADVSFIIDELGRRSADGAGMLAGLIDSERVGVTGHSLGGLTAILAAFGDRRDERVDAILPISPPACMLPPDIADGASVPVMVLGGSAEVIVPPLWIRYAYEAAAAPKYFVSIVGGDHIRFADIDTPDFLLPGIVDELSGGNTEEEILTIAAELGGDTEECVEDEQAADELVSGNRQRELLRTAALPFFDAYLKQTPAAMTFLEQTLPTLDGIRFESELAESDGGD
jgi:predicted dienelactone hydrolase